MTDELIDDDAIEALPDDPGMAFVLFERACRKSLREAVEREENGQNVNALQLDFMHDVVAAAQHFHIPEVKDYRLPATANYPWEKFEEFNRKVRFFVTSYRLSNKAQRNLQSVELQGEHKDRIRTLVAHLKKAVDDAEMPDWRKERLRKHIHDFDKALDSKRLSYVEAFAFVAVVGAGLSGIGDGAEGLGKLVHQITVAIGQSKEIEDTTRPAPPKLEQTKPTYQLELKGSLDTFQRDEMDDEIPF